MTDPHRLVIACTAEDDRYARVRERAVELAGHRAAGLILYDVDAHSPLESPLPTVWSAEGAADEFGDRLDPTALEAAGRPAIARQVAAAREGGLEAWGWLPTAGGLDGLLEYAERQGAELLLVPPDLVEGSPVERLAGGRPEDAREVGRERGLEIRIV
ncbi:MAG TPA: hypothetical protein VNJ28_02985, partial [Candidatus Limnocylindrales bacterium]|nr:hypothetical protein [Candidatus Limnocylindrales bacterium]